MEHDKSATLMKSNSYVNNAFNAQNYLFIISATTRLAINSFNVKYLFILILMFIITIKHTYCVIILFGTKRIILQKRNGAWSNVSNK